nr:MAG TPA: hypothetical protein [Bacteriophage sp.]
MAASGCPIFSDFTLPWSLTSPLLYPYNSLVAKALRVSPQLNLFIEPHFTKALHIGFILLNRRTKRIVHSRACGFGHSFKIF